MLPVCAQYGGIKGDSAQAVPVDWQSIETVYDNLPVMAYGEIIE